MNKVTPKDHLIMACSMIMSDIKNKITPIQRDPKQTERLEKTWGLLTNEDKIAIVKTMRKTCRSQDVKHVYDSILKNFEQGLTDSPISGNLWIKDAIHLENPFQ